MNSLTFIECCRLLAIDPKTLRQWLVQAQISLHVHPTDARIKCLTGEQVNALANLHDRVLLHPVEASDVGSTLCEAQSQTSAMTVADADLRVRLRQLEAQVTPLQAQLTDLALQLLKERHYNAGSHVPTLQAQDLSMQEHALPVPGSPCQPVMPALACHPTEQRSRLIPLIEYGARGQYVLICPKEGELHMTPDSLEWFAWLKSLSSFRFVGQFGHFSARRGYNHRPNRSWYAQRTIHQRYHSKYIGVSEAVTIDRLEHIAADLQSYAKERKNRRPLSPFLPSCQKEVRL
jgi:hypothetical protein